MGRLVEPRPDPALVQADPNQGVKDYLERVAKYVPGEILAAYLTITPVLIGTTEAGSGTRFFLQLVAFLALLFLTPLYFRFMARPGQPKRLQMGISTLGFAVWAYSQGGIFTTIGLYHPGAAALFLILFSLSSGLVAPKPGTR